MTAAGTDREAAPPPALRLRELTISNQIVFQAICAAAELGVADELRGGPQTSQEVAQRLSVHEPSLYRLMRALTVPGLLAELPGRRFALTPLGDTLRTDAPGSMRAYVRFIGSPFRLAAWQELVYSVRTGRAAFDKVHGMPPFDFLGKHPEAAAIFNAAMTSITAQTEEAIADAYDFSGIRKLIDVGGGHGRLLAAILKRNPTLRGVLFELPHAAEGARALFADEGLAARTEVVEGDFFNAIPPGGDAYLMKSIIHDWDDERCLKILGNCHRAMGPRGRLLLVEGVIPPPGEPAFHKLLDLEMLVFPGGLERTEEEFRELFSRASFRLSRVVPTRAASSVIEGIPV
jgi:SAM-dependent methyltransferase